MTARYVQTFVIFFFGISGFSVQDITFAQEPEGEWVVTRTAAGQPDLQGYWTPQTFTPLERPQSLADKEFFSVVEMSLWL